MVVINQPGNEGSDNGPNVAVRQFSVAPRIEGIVMTNVANATPIPPILSANHIMSLRPDRVRQSRDGNSARRSVRKEMLRWRTVTSTAVASVRPSAPTEKVDCGATKIPSS